MQNFGATPGLRIMAMAAMRLVTGAPHHFDFSTLVVGPAVRCKDLASGDQSALNIVSNDLFTDEVRADLKAGRRSLVAAMSCTYVDAFGAIHFVNHAEVRYGDHLGSSHFLMDFEGFDPAQVQN